MAPEPDLLNIGDADIETEHMSEHLATGTSLLNGQYIIESYLSSGGFGITYLARDSLDRPVVIKECYPEALCSRKNKTVKARSISHADEFKSLVSMFVREARNIAKLQHPNIVGVHQIFEDNQTAYMALDLIEGQDLLNIIEGAPNSLTPAIVESLLLKLLDAISAVHAQDMLHRDISPDNILLDPWGNPILIDFGAAREQASKKSRAISAFLVVKDGYSPQEFYINGGQQGPSSDLYSLAATFFHAITGKPPPNSQIRIAAIAANRPDPYAPLAGRVSGYSSGFLEAIDLAMNVFPNDRIGSAQDWIAILDPASRPVALAPRNVRPDVMHQIIAELVTETTKKIEEDILTQPSVAEAKEPEASERVWEYLSEEETGEPDCEPPSLPEKPETENVIDIEETLLPGVNRARRRRMGLLMILGGLAGYFHFDPHDSLAVLSDLEVQQMVERGLSWTPRISEFLTPLL